MSHESGEPHEMLPHTLPAEDAGSVSVVPQYAGKPRAASREAGACTRCTILLVEDNPADVRLLVEAMKIGKSPATMYLARDGVEALEFLRHRPPFVGAPRPDLILLDLNLPRMSGLDVLRELKRDEHLCDIPVIVLTTSSALSDVRAAYDLQANCYVVKPVDVNGLVDAMERIERFWFRIARLPSESWISA